MNEHNKTDYIWICQLIRGRSNLKNKKTFKWIFALVIVFLLNTLCLISVVYAKEKNTQDSLVLSLSPEQVEAHYKKLRGYKIHTVVWLDDYTLGNPYGQARESSEKHEFAIHLVSKEKPKKGNYIEIEAIIGGTFLGYIDLDDTVILSKGSQARKILEQIDEQELTSAPYIEGYILKVDQTKQKEAADAADAEARRFEEGAKYARAELKSDKSILTLSPEQLNDKRNNYEGKRFHTVLTVNRVRNNNFTAKLEKDKWGDSFYCYFDREIDLRNHLKKGDAVELIGTIKPGSSNCKDYTSCEIISIGEEAQKVLTAIIKEQKSATKKEPVKKQESKKENPKEVPKENTFSPIAKGASGEPVAEIQKQLLVLGYLTSSVDGSFGPGTEQAVKDFQKAHKLESTGIVNKETYDAITEASFVPIKKGITGDSVVEIQKRLVELGYLTSSADGSFGPGTEQSVKNFQAANGLGTDGVVNENTYNKMFSSEAKRYVAPTPTVAPKQSSDSTVTRSVQERLVWITKTGKRYHSKSHCGSTKSSWQVTLEEAERMGLTPCGKCYR